MLSEIRNLDWERIRLYAGGLWQLRRNDIWLASFPRSGSTWLRNLFLNLYQTLSGTPDQPSLVVLDSCMPTLGSPALLRDWEYPGLPRLIKTHQPYRPVLFAKPRRSVYLSRDPRDVMVSYYLYLCDHPENPFAGSFAEFIRDPRYGLQRVFDHYRSWQAHASCFVRYEQLVEDTVTTFGDLLTELDVTLPGHAAVEEAVRRSSFDVMREAEEQFGMLKSGDAGSGFRMAREGRTGRWREYFSERDLSFFNRVRKQHER